MINIKFKLNIDFLCDIRSINIWLNLEQSCGWEYKVNSTNILVSAEHIMEIIIQNYPIGCNWHFILSLTIYRPILYEIVCFYHVRFPSSYGNLEHQCLHSIQKQWKCVTAINAFIKHRLLSKSHCHNTTQGKTFVS